MKRTKSVNMDTQIYRGEGESETEIEVEVCGEYQPYWPGNYENPPEGGNVEDVEAFFYDDVAKKMREVPLTDEEVKKFSEELAEKVSEDDGDDY
jgi:ribosomal protein L31